MAEKLTFNQVKEQHDSDPTIEPTVLLERSGGVIQTARLTPNTDKYGRYYAAFTDIEDGKPVDKLKPLSRQALSDNRQAELAEALAETLAHDEIIEDTVERPHDIPDKVVHEAGEVALELTGIEEPQPEHHEVEEAIEDDDNAEIDTDVLQAAKAEYASQTRAIVEDMKVEVGTMLGRMSRELEEADGYIRTAGRVLAEETDQLTRIVARLESGEMAPAQAMSYVESAQQTLYGMRNRLQNASEASSSIVREGRAEAIGDAFTVTTNVLLDRDQGFHDFVRDQNDGVTSPEVAHLSTDEVRSEIQRVQGSIDEAMPNVARVNASIGEAAEQLTVAVRRLDQYASSRGAYGTDELRQAVVALRSVDVSRSGLGATVELIEDARMKLQNIEPAQ